jgi:hypothetical protein
VVILLQLVDEIYSIISKSLANDHWSGIMEKTLAIIALVVLGCTALEVVDLIFTMQLYTGLLP